MKTRLFLFRTLNASLVVLFFLPFFVPPSQADDEAPSSELVWLWRKQFSAEGQDISQEEEVKRGIIDVGIADLLGIVAWHDNKTKEALDSIVKMEQGIRQTALRMSNNINLSGYADLIAGDCVNLAQSSLTANHDNIPQNGEASAVPNDLKARMQQVLDKVYTLPFTDVGGKINVSDDRKRLIATFKTLTVPASGKNLRKNPWLLKVSQPTPPTAENPRVLEDMLNETAKALLPEKMFRDFRAEKLIGYILKQARVVSVSANGLIRSSVPQDAAFTEFANIDCNGTDQALFWSDPMTDRGYHPAFGLALNATPLRGYKSVDMDNIVSHGLSQTIDQWNAVQPPEQRVANPFKGYASRVIPGLVVMGEQGRLAPREYPTQEQFTEAMELTKKVKMLPSQFLKGKMQASYKLPNYSCRGGAMNDRYVILVDENSQTAPWWLGSFDQKMYDTTMDETILRLRGNTDKEKDPAKQTKGLVPMMIENEFARETVGEILDTYQKMEQAVANISSGLTDTNSIPQITQLRQAIFASMERWRGQLSDLWAQYSTLKQQEWEILDSIVQTNEKYVKILMERGSMGADTGAVIKAYGK